LNARPRRERDQRALAQAFRPEVSGGLFELVGPKVNAGTIPRSPASRFVTVTEQGIRRGFTLVASAQSVRDRLAIWLPTRSGGDVRWMKNGPWPRVGLDVRSRALVSVTIAATLGTHEPLRGQLRIGLNNGVSKDEIVEQFIHLEAWTRTNSCREPRGRGDVHSPCARNIVRDECD
jgi:alkylhydroperoxidase/carboxymuconolactone decarboxylase family protein YurZ